MTRRGQFVMIRYRLPVERRNRKNPEDDGRRWAQRRYPATGFIKRLRDVGVTEIEIEGKNIDG